MNTASVLAHGAAASELTGARRALWRRAAQEPLFHFLLLGALIFAVAHSVERARSAASAQIVVDDALKQRIVRQQLTQTGVTPGPQQLDAIVERHIDDEVLYREALRLGLDQDDEIIRRRLIQKLEFVQGDLSLAAPPTEAQLHTFFDNHHERFSQPARVSFTHVYFSPDRGGDAAAHERAERARFQLGSPADVPVGDTFPLNSSFADATRNDVTQLFGSSAFVDTLFATPAGAWSEPVRSGYGWHLIKLASISEPYVPAYTDVKADVQAAYLQDANTAAKRRELNTLRSRYRIVRP